MRTEPFSYWRPAARDGNGTGVDDAAPGDVLHLFGHMAQRQTGYPRAKTFCNAC
jgi:hypothetical protein